MKALTARKLRWKLCFSALLFTTACTDPFAASAPGSTPPPTGGGGGGGGPVVSQTIPPAFSNRQVIRVASPKTAMTTMTDPMFGLIGGYSQDLFSQSLAFAPNTQVVIANFQTLNGGKPHTLNVLSTTAFPAPVPAPSGGTSLPTTASGGNMLTTGYATGVIAPGNFVGPVVLVAGTYYVGCAFHYPDGHRDVIVVKAGAMPGPEAKLPAGAVAPPPLGTKLIGGY